MKKYELWEQALMFAAEAHDKAYRKGTMLPYIVHPIEVSFIVAEMTEDEEVIAAAALHDVVEDTKYSIEDIRLRFGDRIAGYVEAESENKRKEMSPEASWKIRKQEFLDKLPQEPAEIKMIALADKLSNMRSTMKEYRKIGDDIWKRFNQKDKREHRWYHTSILGILKEFQECDSWKEYKELCDVIFGCDIEIDERMT